MFVISFLLKKENVIEDEIDFDVFCVCYMILTKAQCHLSTTSITDPKFRIHTIKTSWPNLIIAQLQGTITRVESTIALISVFEIKQGKMQIAKGG